MHVNSVSALASLGQVYPQWLSWQPSRALELETSTAESRMAFAGAAHKGAQKCLCHSRGPVLRSPALSGRSSLAALLREDRRRGRYNSPRRPSITTYVAAVEEAPSAQSAPSTSEEDEEFKFAIDFTNTDDLYKRFNELLERQSMDIKLGDKVTGTISR